MPSVVAIDRYALCVFTFSFFAYQVGTLIWMYCVPLKKRRLMFAKDSARRKEQGKANYINMIQREDTHRLN